MKNVVDEEVNLPTCSTFFMGGWRGLQPSGKTTSPSFNGKSGVSLPLYFR